MAAAQPQKPAASGKAPKQTQSGTKAQRAFAEYKARMGAWSGPQGFGPHGQASPMYQGPYGGPAWAMPPSVGAFMPGPGMPFAAPGLAPGMAGSLSERVGAALRMGVELVNVSLMGGLRVVDGFMGAAFEHYGDEWSHGGHGGRCCHEESCGHGCCEDCCELLEGCCPCEPSVGSCC